MDRAAARHPVREDLALLLKLSWPVVLSRLGIMTMGLSDAVVVGRYSATQLGYHALAWALTSIVVTMAIGLLTGVQVMTARAIGAGRPQDAGAVLRRGLAYGLWIGLGCAVVLACVGAPLLHAIGLERDLANGASRVLLVFCLSLPGYALSVAASFWMEGLGRPGPGAWAMWLANGVNLALDLLLVPGAFGLPALGAMGGAWATTGARSFLAVAMLVYIARMADARALGVFSPAPRDRPAEVEQRRIGFGAGVSNLFEVAAFASMSLIAGWIGGLAVAAWAVVLNVMAIIFMAPLGFGTATAVVVGRAYGARDAAGVRRGGYVAFAVTAVFGIVAGLLLWPFTHTVAAGYTSEVHTIAMAAPALALACFMFVPDALQVVIAQALRARGDVWVPSGTHLMSYVLVMMPLAWWLAIPMGMGLQGVVAAIIVASLISMSLLLGRFWMLSRQAL